MKCIILAGGFGTRLRSITGDQIPKCMAKGMFRPGTRDVPWLEIIIRQLKKQGITDITLALHYKAEVFTEWFGDKLKYKIEDRPLGTGGAIRNCIEGNEPVLVLNGDTYAKCDFNDMLAKHISPLTVAVTQNKGYMTSAGVYIISPELFNKAPKSAFSFETFIMPMQKKFYIIEWFGDMGSPEGYEEVKAVVE